MNNFQLPKAVPQYKDIVVPVKRLKLVSDQNYNDGFNRNIDCDALLKVGITEIQIMYAITHYHKGGVEVPEHLRLCFYEYNLHQDITYDQMEDMMEDINILQGKYN